MPHPYLPKLKSGTDNQFSAPSKPGVWEERPNTHLGQLAAAIEIPPTKAEIYSVPDPWAWQALIGHCLTNITHCMKSLGENGGDCWR